MAIKCTTLREACVPSLQLELDEDGAAGTHGALWGVNMKELCTGPGLHGKTLTLQFTRKQAALEK